MLCQSRLDCINVVASQDWIAEMLEQVKIGLQKCWSKSTLDCRNVGASQHWIAEMLEQIKIGLQ